MNKPTDRLDALADRVEAMGEFRNPIIEQALRQGLQQQALDTVERAETAGGLTGSAQVGAATLALLEQAGQASLAAHQRRVDQQRALLDAQIAIEAESAGLKESRYQTNLAHRQFMAQLRAQEKASKRNLGASIAGGALAAFAGGGFGGIFGAAAGGAK